MAWDDKSRHGRRGGAGGFDKIPEFDLSKFKPPGFKTIYILYAIPILIGLWLFSGLYKVALQERAVVLVVGKHVATTVPGLHWNVPAPFGRVIKVKTEEIKRVEIGFRTGASRMSRQALLKEAQMLTQGENIVDAHMSVQYQINDPGRFLFGVSDTSRRLLDRGLYETVKNVAEAALRDVVGRNEIDAVLTFGRSRIQEEVRTLMQEILDRYSAGLTINLVQLQDVFPPDEVRESFRDVNNAKEDKNRLIREAEGYYNSIIPETRGKAAQVVAKAEAYREQRMKLAEGDALRFERQLTEYLKAPEITRKRLYIESMETVLTHVDKIIIDTGVMGSILPVLPLGGMEGFSTKKE